MTLSTAFGRPLSENHIGVCAHLAVDLLLFTRSDRSFPGDSVVKNLPAKQEAIPGSGRSLGGENGNPLQYSCLENPMDRGAWQAIVHGVAEESYTHTK